MDNFTEDGRLSVVLLPCSTDGKDYYQVCIVPNSQIPVYHDLETEAAAIALQAAAMILCFLGRLPESK